MNSPVTWLLAVKNGMPYLPDTLASIKAQTYTNGQVLAWDNGSTDGTVDVLNEWIPSRLPGRVVADSPLPLARCRAELVQQSPTELCAWTDADDVSLPERLEKQVAFLETHPDIALVGSQINRIDENGVNHGSHYPTPLHHDDLVHFMLHNNPFSQPSVLFRRSAVLDVGNYRDVGKVNVEDYDLWLRLAVRHKLANVPERLLDYRVHGGSTTQQSSAHNILHEAISRCIAQNSPALYGISEKEARKIRDRKHFFAFYAFCKVARHLQYTQGGHWRARMKSPAFVLSMRTLAARKTPMVKLFVALYGKHIINPGDIHW